MAIDKYEFGLVSRLSAESVGEPGKRTFRLSVDSPAGLAVLWLEKEQLLELSLSMKRALGMLEEKGEDIPSPPPESGTGSLQVEFNLGKQAIEYDRDAGIFRFFNHDIEADDQDSARLIFEATVGQVSKFSDEALAVCAAGRPLCPLCHQPMNAEGHFCARSNGHPPEANAGWE